MKFEKNKLFKLEELIGKNVIIKNNNSPLFNIIINNITRSKEKSCYLNYKGIAFQLDSYNKTYNNNNNLDRLTINSYILLAFDSERFNELNELNDNRYEIMEEDFFYNNISSFFNSK